MSTASVPSASVQAKFRTWFLAKVRASRFWPLSLLDKQADVKRLNTPLDASIVVFFPMKVDALYQVRQWYRVLKELNAVHRVSLVFRDSRTASLVREESALDCLTLANYGQLDHLLSMSDVKLFLYVSHDAINFEALRFTSVLHIYIGHGDSDKGVAVSNQLKAYDYSLQPGQAAVDRLAGNLMRFDAAANSMVIGQPQLDGHRLPASSPSNRSTVLYAPTWEGSQPSVSYGSVARFGEEIIRSLRDEFRIIYRPHPFTGIADNSYGAADARCRSLAHRVDVNVPIQQSIADADILITDVSAVALNWLPSGKPLLITEPAVPTGPSRLLENLPRISTPIDAPELVRVHLETDPLRDARQQLIAYYVDDIREGVSTKAFLEACSSLIQSRDTMWSELQSKGAVGP